jgi:DNA-directed RNA polymerase specialized sigma24 family protein
MRTMTASWQFGQTNLYHEAITSITYLQQQWHDTCAPMGIGRAGQSRHATGCRCRPCSGYPSDASGGTGAGGYPIRHCSSGEAIRRRHRKRKIMSWFHSSTAAFDTRNHASPAEVVACFEHQRNVLGRLAFLITNDQATADQAVVRACEITLQGNHPFRDWLFEWAKAATIASAISHGTEAIRICEAAYKDRRCPHVEHLSPGDAEVRAASLDLILGADAKTLVADLDPLCRAVLVLRVAIRSSIQDCALRLNVSRAAVRVANCQVLTWLHEQ